MTEAAIAPARSNPLAAALGDIKLAHTVFAMPFAILGAALAFEPEPSAGRIAIVLALVVVCMIFARTWAMLVNRLADAKFDADNPRTAGRAVASGRLGAQQGWAIALGAAALFCGAAVLFWPLTGNPWPTYLCVPVLGFAALYSYTKRFTALCHVFLGAALAVSPLAAGLAVRPEALADVTALYWLAGFVVLWVAGFDVIYALQDLDFDQGRGLHSIPSALGWRGAVWVSRAMHAAAFASLVFSWRADDRHGVIYASGVAGVGLLLAAEHVTLARRGREGIPMVFFTYNGVASLAVGAAGVLDLVV
ncbi:MAG: 4-hydroxybenzoate octaprenyltransferase [Planctomycetota bacterium]